MINASQTVKDLLKSNIHISISAGATIEYNLNSMVDKITAISSGTDHALSNSFKKLFPIDTIYKPFRPMLPGIKYLIYTTGNTDTPSNSFDLFREIGMSDKPRLYYPGIDTVYKYWLGPKGEDISVSLEYFNDDDPQTNKMIPSNKVVARFEIGHGEPASCQFTLTKSDDTTVTVNVSELNANGEAMIYYNGTSWSTIEPESFSNTQYIKKVQLQAVNSNSGKFLAVLELSPRWVVDISNDVESFTINKETGADQGELLPVGTLTANSLSMGINKFEQNVKNIIEYNREDSIDNTKIYLTKNALVRPYINIKNGSTDNKIYQGYFYMHSWELFEFGNAQIVALDSAKILQETLAPEILVENAPVTAIIKRLLDSVGFSSYKIYVKKNEDEEVDDNSVPKIAYWWSEDGKTVWECLQELCRDIQMNAFVDENNILNFYTRDYIYDSNRLSDWDFTSEEDGTTLPNIISFASNEAASANSVKIIWSAPSSSQFDGSASPLWKSEEAYLGAGTLAVELQSNDQYFSLNNSTFDANQNIQALFGFNGYMLLNDEIIEYDGVEYQYVPINSQNNTPIPVIVKSQSDIFKYAYLSKAGYSNLNDPNSAYFKPTGRYKIKSRGALGTKVPELPHKISPDSYINKPGENDASKFNRYKIDLVSKLEAGYKPGNGFYKNPVPSSAGDTHKSFLQLTNLDKNKTTFDTAVKEFNSLDTSKEYFAFGTRMFFHSQFESPAQIGGLSLFTNSTGEKGYHVVLHTTASAKLQKDVRILKRYTRGGNEKVKVLKDTQTTSLNTLAGIYAGQAYNVDVLVKKISATQNKITVFINGFKISTFDTTAEEADIVVPPVSPTKYIGLLCGQGVVYFEYVYAKSITQAEYDLIEPRSFYKYNGIYSDDALSLLHGNLIYNFGDDTTKTEPGLIEFGTTAREIKNAKVRYTDRPSIPIKFSTGNNQFVTSLGTRIQPFKAETFVLNNTSTYVPIDDGDYSSFYVLGNTIYKSSPIEYVTDEQTDTSFKEPVIFESNWLQTESDVKSLADWIKTTVLNKGKFIEMSVFGNPLISPGDIITINYPLQGLTKENGKYIVTNVTTEYAEGVSTSISCRAI